MSDLIAQLRLSATEPCDGCCYGDTMTEAAAELTRLTAEVAELQANEAAYERIVGKKTYQEVADEIAKLREENERLRKVYEGGLIMAEGFRDERNQVARERDAALAEVERVKGALRVLRKLAEQAPSDPGEEMARIVDAIEAQKP